MNTYADSLNAALKYGVEEARAVSWGTNTTREAAALAHQAAAGDDLALSLLADKLQDHDHPAHHFLNRIRDGEGIEGSPSEQRTLSLYGAKGSSYSTPEHFFVLTNEEQEKQGGVGVGSLTYLHLPEGHFAHVQLRSNERNTDNTGFKHERSWILPATEDEIKKYADGVGEIQGDYPHQNGGKEHFYSALNEKPVSSGRYHGRRLQDAGLGHLAPAEEPAEAYAADVNEALKYVDLDRSDWHRSLSEKPNDAHQAMFFADWLEENGDPKAAKRVREEAAKTLVGHTPKPVRLGDPYSDHDFVLHALRTGHPNPTVRAMAGEFGELPHPDLFDLLLHSDQVSDRDAAIYLHPEDSPRTHTAHSFLSRLNTNANRMAGLTAKVVRGVVHLMDYEAPNHRAYGAPGIIYDAPVTDTADLEGMIAHAASIAAQRNAVEGAFVGPAH